MKIRPSSLIIRLLLAYFLFFTAAPAIAKDLGSLISPGELSSLHEELDGIIKCTKCHGLGSGISNDNCLDCHKDIDKLLKADRGFHTTVKNQKCITCHTEHKGRKGKLVDWKEKSFDHKKSGYPLLGKHKKTACGKCHTAKTKKGQKTYLGLSTTCLSCHKKDDKHKGKLGTKCEDCHQVTSWKKILFKHDKTKYPLLGKHAQVKCEKCHPGKKRGEFQVAEYGSCNASGCHDTKKRGNIHGDQFKNQRCDSCHTVSGFKKELFKHESPKYTGYKLKGKHARVKCADCHRKGKKRIVVYKPIETATCSASGCHDTKKRGNIHGKQFKDQRCDSCHTEDGFKKTLFKHDDPKYTGYKLKGKHAELKCEGCHRKNRRGVVKFKPIESKSCDAPGCHDTKKRGNIHGKQFKNQRCDSCHTVKGFKETLFSHDDPKYKGYKLKGKHAELKCELCHRKNRRGLVKFKPFETKSCDASGCHDTKERGYIHGRQFKGQRCAECHTVSGWKKLIFDHNKQGKFPLLGKHKQTKCEKCHVKKVWKPVKDTCISCHKKDDKHKGEFGKQCESCHSAKSWQPENFFHEITGFKLDGAHAQSVCEDCHKAKGLFGGLGSECGSCHMDPHFNQFGALCEDCHTARNWLPEKFRHNDTGFRLEGAHRIAECEQCHTNRDYRSTSTECIDCHRSDFTNATLTVFHQNANTDCTDCHRVYSFIPAVKHAHQFMTFTGAHVAVRHSCDTCHSRANWNLYWPGAAVETDCDICHQAGFAAAPNDAHAFYPATIAACTNCHTSTSTWFTRFRHSFGSWSGAHIAVEDTCTTCHQPGSATLIAAFTGATSPSDCAICHEAADYNPGNWGHGTGSTDCAMCHTTTAWLPASVLHTIMTFTGDHAGFRNDCTKCHVPGSTALKWGGVVTSPNDCIVCHQKKFDDEHGGEGKDPDRCSSCHTTSTWDR